MAEKVVQEIVRVECDRVPRENERGWTARLTVNDEVAVSCPECGEREFGGVRLVIVNDQLGNRGQVDRDLDAFFRGEAVCERHPNKPWPHDDCPGPGMPPRNEKAGTHAKPSAA